MGGGVDKPRTRGTGARYRVGAIAWIAVATVMLSGCGYQETSQSAYSPPSALTSPSSQARRVTSRTPVDSKAGSLPPAPGSGGTSGGGTTPHGKAPARTTASGLGSGTGSGPQASGSNVQSSGTGNCPTAGVGGDPVPPPCPVAAQVPSSDGIQGIVTASPTTSSGSGGRGTCPTAAPSATAIPDLSVTPSPAAPPTATACPVP
jgi:hypothetical protein